jgi:ectoine hydroxylase-related dioxygenase (phytanoyl-CoA dioxygenase family)
MPEPTITLAQEQIDFFHREGYLAIEAITTQEEVARMRVIYDRLFENRAGREEGNQFDLAGTDEDDQEAKLPQILGPSRYEPELKDSLYFANAFAISTQLLGEGTVPMGDHAILKPARQGAPTPWHQDEAYWNPELEYFSLSVWMPLQEATLENGCMQFIPGSHLWEVQPHHTINHDPRIHGLEADEIDDSNAVACPMPPGGATFHLSRTFHYTSSNRTDQPRRAYILGFGHPPKKRETTRDFHWNRTKRTPREERAIKATGKNEEPMKKPIM